jgi:hypothetical protein
MKIALITGGQPRFTFDFIKVMNQIKGFDTADIYMNLWSSDWAQTNEQARSKIEKILLPKYTLAKVNVVDQPPYDLPPHKNPVADPQPENIHWWYRRGIGQSVSLSMAFDLIDQQYDAVIRFRLDGCISHDIDVSNLDLINNELITPSGPVDGIDGYKINDQFAIGTQEGMKFYCGLGKEYRDLVPLAQPDWENTPVGWTIEYLLGVYMKKYNKTHYRGTFASSVHNQGRSRFADKHFHHFIAQDPTEV